MNILLAALLIGIAVLLCFLFISYSFEHDDQLKWLQDTFNKSYDINRKEQMKIILPIEIPEAKELAESVVTHIYGDEYYDSENDSLQSQLYNFIINSLDDQNLESQMPKEYVKEYYHTLNTLKNGSNK